MVPAAAAAGAEVTAGNSEAASPLVTWPLKRAVTGDRRTASAPQHPTCTEGALRALEGLGALSPKTWPSGPPRAWLGASRLSLASWPRALGPSQVQRLALLARAQANPEASKGEYGAGSQPSELRLCIALLALAPQELLPCGSSSGESPSPAPASLASDSAGSASLASATRKLASRVPAPQTTGPILTHTKPNKIVNHE